MGLSEKTMLSSAKVLEKKVFWAGFQMPIIRSFKNELFSFSSQHSYDCNIQAQGLNITLIFVIEMKFTKNLVIFNIY